MVAQIDRQYFSERPAKAIQRLLSYGLFEGRPLTTRGRWINPVVFALGRLFMRIPCRRSVESPIYILGQGRSGTTVLGLVLSVHRDVGYLNEPKALWHNAFPHEDIIGNFTNDRGRYVLTRSDADTRTSQNFQRLYSWYLWASRAARVIDKYPEVLFRTAFVKEIFPDAKFIVILRDGESVCRSIEKWSETFASATSSARTDWWGKEDRKWTCLIDELVEREPDLSIKLERLRSMSGQIDRAALEWLLTMREAARVRANYPADTVLLRYETLVEHPGETLGKLLDFCGLSHDPELVAYARKKLVSKASSSSAISVSDAIKDEFYEQLSTYRRSSEY